GSLSAATAASISASVKGRSGTALDNRPVAIPDTRERPLRLTSLSHGAGCACKIPPGVLHPLLADLPRSDDPALLVGHESADVAAEAGVAIVGGHSIDDAEPKYGLAVTGAVDPRRLLRNSTARAGDALYLTKPVGGGVASTAAKRGIA